MKQNGRANLPAPASCMNSDYFRAMDFLKGLRSRQDLCYQRPLTLEKTPPGHRWEKPPVAT